MGNATVKLYGLIPLFEDYNVFKAITQCAKLRGLKRWHFILESITANDKDFDKLHIDVARSEQFHKYLKEQATKHKTSVMGYVERCCINHCHNTMQEILPKKDSGYGF